jgi:TonB family protein
VAPQKILIVDSDLEAAGTLASFLFGKGFGVIQASDGQVGFQLFQFERPHLVITETILPLLHGFELCSRIQKDPASVPVVILSESCEDESFRAEAMRVFGAAAYLGKPFDGEAILATIKRLLAPPVSAAKDGEIATGPFDAGKRPSGGKAVWWKKVLAAAGFLLIVSALVYIVAAKKSPSPSPLPSSNGPASFPSDDPEVEAASPTSEIADPISREDPKKTEPAGAIATNPPAPPEETIKPLVPDEIPRAALSIPAAKPAEESEIRTKRTEARPDPPKPAAKTAARGDLIELAQADVPPRLLKSVEPGYPSPARERRLEGQVALEALISEDGMVREVRLVKGPGTGFGFEAASQKALLKWTYRPAEKDGVPLRVWKPSTIVFKPGRSDPWP